MPQFENPKGRANGHTEDFADGTPGEAVQRRRDRNLRQRTAGGRERVVVVLAVAPVGRAVIRVDLHRLALDDLVSGLGDGGANRVIIDPAAGNGESPGVDIDVDAADCRDFGDFLAHRERAMRARHSGDGVLAGLFGRGGEKRRKLPDTGRGYTTEP